MKNYLSKFLFETHTRAVYKCGLVTPDQYLKTCIRETVSRQVDQYTRSKQASEDARDDSFMLRKMHAFQGHFTCTYLCVTGNFRPVGICNRKFSNLFDNILDEGILSILMIDSTKKP